MVKSKLCLLAVVAIAIARYGDAAIIEWSFDALVRDVAAGTDFLASAGVVEGTQIGGTFLVDNGTAPTDLGDNLFFPNAVVGFELSLGTLGVQWQSSSSLNSLFTVDSDVDQVIAVAYALVLSGPFGYDAFARLRLADSGGGLVSGNAVPSLPALAELNPYSDGATGTSLLVDSAGTFSMEAELTRLDTRVVPLPGAVYLMLGALLWLTRLRSVS